MNKKIEVDVLLTPKDLLQMNYWYLIWTGGIWIIFWTAVWSIIGLVSLMDPENVWDWRILMPLIFIISIVFFLVGRLFNHKKQFKLNKALSFEQHWQISEEEISYTSQVGSSNSYWSIIYKAYETKHAFLILIASGYVYLLPKRSFASQDDITETRSILKTQLGDRFKIRMFNKN